MHFKAKYARLLILSILLMIVIFDSATAIGAALQGIERSVKTVIPGVFPILFLCSVLASELKNISVPSLESKLRIPTGTAGYFLIGLLCGYPVGAKLMENAIQQKEIHPQDGARMISFCNNASPAFIIGVLSPIFKNSWIGIIMLFIQIISSFFVGCIIPGSIHSANRSSNNEKQNIGRTMSESIKAIAVICGWIIIFGIIIAYIQNRIGNNLTPVSSAIISGLLELSSGLQALQGIKSPAIQFTIASVMLSFGGICVLIQTKSVAPTTILKPYILSKALHAGLSGALSSFVGLFIFIDTRPLLLCVPLFLSASAVIAMIFHFNKKMVAFD